MSAQQPDHLPVLQSFHTWIRDISIGCRTISEDGTITATNTFVPTKQIISRFRSDDYDFVERLRDAVLGNDAHRVFARDIVLNCPIIFCILLSIGRGRYVLQFVRSYDLSDQRLPFLEDARKSFPVGNDDFWNDFYARQWEFCAPELHSANHREFRAEHILPFVSREYLGGGGSASIDRIAIHGDYDLLHEQKDEAHAPPPSHCYALKTYTGPSAKTYYRREVEAFMRLSESARKYPSPSMVRYFGSFSYQDSYNVLLEYADGGTLDHYFENQAPPSQGSDIIAFWRSYFEVTKALARLHEQDLDANDPNGHSVLHGWHQDIKPANILIFRCGPSSPYQWSFKLADLGLSHFKEVTRAQHDPVDLHADGTRTYGAPECYAWSEFLQRQRLQVKKSTDMWSYGCVCSEAAVWVVSGWSGLQEYRRARAIDEDKHPGFLGGNCFHNGKGIRTSVVCMHEKISDEIRHCDFITGKVLSMVKRMLRDEPDARTMAKTLIYDVDEALHEAEAEHSRWLEDKRKSTSPAISPPPSGRFRPPPLRDSRHAQRTRTDRESAGSHASGRSRVLDGLITESPRGSLVASTSSEEHGEYYPSRTAELEDPFVGDSGSLDGPSRLETKLAGETGHSTGAVEGLQRSRTHLSKRDTLAEEEPWDRNERAPPSAARSQHHEDVPYRSRTTASSSRRPQTEQPLAIRTQNQRSVTAGHAQPRVQPQQHNLDADMELAKQVEAQWAAEEVGPAAPRTMTNGNIGSPQQRAAATAAIAIPQTTRLFTRQPPDFLSVANAIQWRKSKGHESLDYAKYLNHLDKRDHVFLVDDSERMAPYWREMLALLESLAYMVKKGDPDGTELFFMLDSRTKRSKASSKLLELARKVQASDTVDASVRLDWLVQRYLNEIHSQAVSKTHWIRGTKAVRPLSIYVMTTGIWQPGCDLTPIFTNLVHKLVARRVGHAPIGIQFIRFGNDPEAIRVLEHYDNNLNLPMDVIDTEPSNGNVWKMLLGAINTWFDDDPAELTSSAATS